MSVKPDNSDKEKAEVVAKHLELEDVARNSFISLCEKGCEPEFLGEYFSYLISKPTVAIYNKSKSKVRKVSLRPMDDLEVALEGFYKKDLEPLKEKLLEVARQIQKLNRTRLVRYLDEHKYNSEIYRIPPLLQMYAQQFIPLLLVELKSIGKRQKPNFNNYLNEICNHVKVATGKDNYKFICDVLNGIGIDCTAESLKQWRHRQKLEDEKQNEDMQ